MTTAITKTKCSFCIRGPSPCQYSSICNEDRGYDKFHPITLQENINAEGLVRTEEPKTEEPKDKIRAKPPTQQIKPGASADYYILPVGATQLQDLIAFRDMNAQLGEIFRAAYRYGQPGHHSSKERDLRKIIFYAQAELDRLEKYVGKEIKI
jgi:hypothetical protein